MISCILCPIDGSEHSDKAATLAADLAERYGAKLCFLHVFMRGLTIDELQRFSEHAHLKDIVAEETRQIESILSAAAAPYGAYLPPPSPETITKIGEVVLEDAQREATERGITQVTTALVSGDPAEQILERAKSLNADMIVMGNRGHGTFRGLLTGSVSSKVSHLAECTCVTVK